MTITTKQIAYFHPEPMWGYEDGNYIKSLLLLFDGLALLVPEYMGDLPSRLDPSIAEPLADLGLLTVIRPESAVTPEVAKDLSEMILELVTAGAFERTPDGGFERLSSSRAGFNVAPELAGYMHQVLIEEGLAAESDDGLSIPMNPRVRLAYLLLLGQMSRRFAGVGDLDLHPVTPEQYYDHDESMFSAFLGLLGLPGMPSANKAVVLAHDLRVVDIDLHDVPLGEILDYRHQNEHDYTRYAADVRDFALKLSLIDDAYERQRALDARELELFEVAQTLRRRVRSAWSQPKTLTGVALGVAGAAWSLATGSFVPAGLAALGVAQRLLPDRPTGSAYNYIIRF